MHLEGLFSTSLLSDLGLGSLTYNSTLIPLFFIVGFGSALSLYPRPAVSPQGWVESAVLITQVDIQRESLPGLGHAPLLASLWPGAMARLLLVVWLSGWAAGGARWRGVVPLPSGGRGGNKKQCDFSSNGPRHYREFVELTVLFTLVCKAKQTYSCVGFFMPRA